jgi:hypothetical protein
MGTYLHFVHVLSASRKYFAWQSASLATQEHPRVRAWRFLAAAFLSADCDFPVENIL